ncbi:MAG: hypothetical protein AAB152_14400 [Candidatus Coatesbacteria bacterium]
MECQPPDTAGPILAATAHLVDSAPVWELGVAALRRDPWAFVDRK